MEAIERYLLANHRCSERCRQIGPGLAKHNQWAVAVLNGYGDIAAQQYIKAASERGDIKEIQPQ